MKVANTKVNRITLTKARVNLGAVIKRVHLQGEYFILEKDGIPVAGMMSVDEFEDYLELRNPKIIKQIAQSKNDLDAGRVRNAWSVLDDLKKVEVAKRTTSVKKSAKTS